MVPATDNDPRPTDLDLIRNVCKLWLNQFHWRKPCNSKRLGCATHTVTTGAIYLSDDATTFNDAALIPTNETRRSCVIGPFKVSSTSSSASSSSNSNDIHDSTCTSPVNPSPLNLFKWNAPSRHVPTWPVREITCEESFLDMLGHLLPQINVLAQLHRLVALGTKSPPDVSDKFDLIGFQAQLSYHLCQSKLPTYYSPSPRTEVDKYITKTFVHSIVYGLMTSQEQRTRRALGSICITVFQHAPAVRRHLLQEIEFTAAEYLNWEHSKLDFNVESMVRLIGAIVRLTHNTERHKMDGQERSAIYDSAQHILSLFCRGWSCTFPAFTCAVLSANTNAATNPAAKALVASTQWLVHASPVNGLAFLSGTLLRRWPSRDTTRQLIYLGLIPMLLVQLTTIAGRHMEGLNEVVHAAFARIQSCINSPHLLVAKQACELCDDLNLVGLFLLRDRALLDMLMSAHEQNISTHWSKHIQALSEDHFDSLSDLV
ncbi:Aste57867_2402 [Aphanomyces stellatus]|uniref:Aste57867_2402 protein n=1 Tax=Aphanomyces stellatus TaxID=120398 RepID=A0A485KA18_9STRA|nr:hypothetical protein As57867_002396 [Aphanomyces stellatus]VFT79603.1 Aste57867_2402 [Aphanomyces stellatus]